MIPVQEYQMKNSRFRNDDEAMLYAIALGNNARISAPPNPWVGCVIVKDNVIVGEGYSQPAGQAHAEVMALNQAGDKAQGATAYVSLEPCCHHGRTPPCTNALIKAKIRRVVVALQDPDTRVCNKGIQQLQNAGIEVSTGVCTDTAEKIFEPYIWHRKTGQPFCVAKSAISIDGRIAAQDLSSQWITCEKARSDAHLLRAQSQAILVGAGTAQSDKPNLTIRHGIATPPKPPLRVVLDSNGSVIPPSPLFNTTVAPTLIITSDKCKPKVLAAWKETGVEVEVLPLARSGAGVELKSVLELLGRRGIIQVLVEGGARLISSFMMEGLINRFVVYVGGCILGHTGIPLFSGIEVPNISVAPRMQLVDTYRVGNSVRIEFNAEMRSNGGLMDLNRL